MLHSRLLEQCCRFKFESIPVGICKTAVPTIYTKIKGITTISMTRLKDEFPRKKSRLVKHDKVNCECHICWREIIGLPPRLTVQEEIATYCFEEREVKRAKRKAKKEVKSGKQATINSFFTTPQKVTVSYCMILSCPSALVNNTDSSHSFLCSENRKKREMVWNTMQNSR